MASLLGAEPPKPVRLIRPQRQADSKFSSDIRRLEACGHARLFLPGVVVNVGASAFIDGLQEEMRVIFAPTLFI